MTDTKETEFQEKLIFFVFLLLFFKAIYTLVMSIIQGSFTSFITTLMIIVCIFFAIFALLRSLFGAASLENGYGGGTSTIGDSQFQSLVDRYENLCEEYIEKKQYKKAAYIQLKLLRNPYRAAHILKAGHVYNEAAVIFLKKCKNKIEAAECYAHARSYTKAVQLYKELEMNEEVGDIYAQLKDTKKAFHHYQIVVDDYKKNYQYVQAALLYRKKMNNVQAANNLLLNGWETNKDAVNCANNLFANYKDTAQLNNAIINFKKDMVNVSNEENFLKVLQLEYKREIAPKETIQDMAYQLISKHHHNDMIISMLSSFVNDDSQLNKDIMRFRRDSK